MEIANLIFAVINFIMSGFCLVWILVKHFSQTHIQFVPAESLIPQRAAPKIGEDFEEFDQVSPMPLSEEELAQAKRQGLV